MTRFKDSLVMSAMVLIATATLLITSSAALATPPPTPSAVAAIQSVRTHFSPGVAAKFQQVMSTARGRAQMQLAFNKAFGKAAKVQLVTTPANTGARPYWSCPGGVGCGVSSSGGWHFWVVMSYAAAGSSTLSAMFLSCSGALSPIVSPPVAVSACGGITFTLWVLINNWPRFTNQGVWVAVYTWGIASGRY